MILALALVALLLMGFANAASDDSRKVVPATEILDKIEKGEPVDYDSVIIEGNLTLTNLELPIEFIERDWFELDLGLLPERYRVNSSIKIVNSDIRDDVDFKNAVFEGLIDFTGTNFRKTSEFSGSDFCEDVVFWDVVFTDEARFRQTRFTKKATYVDTKFLGPADFENTNFSKLADFAYAEFFDKSIFGRTAEDFQFTDDPHFTGSHTPVGDSKPFAIFPESAYFSSDAIFLMLNLVMMFILDKHTLVRTRISEPQISVETPISGALNSSEMSILAVRR